MKNKDVLTYWDNPNVESMYDKNLINLEIELINSRIEYGSKILDAGCGEGEGTLVYAQKGIVHAADFSTTRLEKARERLIGVDDVKFFHVDFLGDYELDYDYDYIVSQRFLINLMDWSVQKGVILDLMGRLRPGGRLLMLEGSLDGVRQLNAIRGWFGMEPIPVKWHNLFFNDIELGLFLKDSGLKIVEKDGLGEFFLLTRGIRPLFDSDLHWDCKYNFLSAGEIPRRIMGMKEKCSRLVLWVIEKECV